MSDIDETHVLSFDAADSAESRQQLAEYFQQQGQKLQSFPGDGDMVELAIIKRDLAEAAVGLGEMEEAWTQARQALNIFIEKELWNEAVECCDILYRADQPASVVALGHGIWLAVTYPVEPQLTINMIQHFIDETPAESDGAAVAAVTAHYVVDMRTEGERRESLSFLTNNMLYGVAQRHGKVHDQPTFSTWMERLELLEPEKFLKRFGMVIGAIVPNEQWWFDRDVLRARLPDQ